MSHFANRCFPNPTLQRNVWWKFQSRFNNTGHRPFVLTANNYSDVYVINEGITTGAL